MALPDTPAPVSLGDDATNRAVRTFLVSLLTDVGVAAALVLVTAFNSAQGWDDFDWAIIGFTLGKTVVVTAGSYVLRRFADPSRIPTPLPPAPVPAPKDASAVWGMDDPPPASRINGLGTPRGGTAESGPPIEFGHRHTDDVE